MNNPLETARATCAGFMDVLPGQKVYQSTANCTQALFKQDFQVLIRKGGTGDEAASKVTGYNFAKPSRFIERA